LRIASNVESRVRVRKKLGDDGGWEWNRTCTALYVDQLIATEEQVHIVTLDQWPTRCRPGGHEQL
jgi:hypothetical protein